MGLPKTLDAGALATLLGRVEPFVRTARATRLAIVNASKTCHYNRRAYVWRQRERAESIAFVLAGRLDVVRTTNEGGRFFLRAYLTGRGHRTLDHRRLRAHRRRARASDHANRARVPA